MPVAALMGLCESGLNEIARVRLKPENIFWVGARDLDAGETETIERLGIVDNVYSTERVHEMGMAAVMEDIRRKMEALGIDAVHLSFDIDGMDPSIVWATGTRVENGLMQEDLEAFIEGLRRLPEMKSMDFVEYNPLMDDEEKRTGKWCVETLKRILDFKI
jgi:arginase